MQFRLGGHPPSTTTKRRDTQSGSLKPQPTQVAQPSLAAVLISTNDRNFGA